MNHTVTKTQSGARLDKLLVELKPELTRSQIQKMIKAGNITVNGKTVPAHYFVHAGDLVAVTEQKTENGKQISENLNLLPTTYSLLPHVITETPDYLILEKPFGLLVHPTQKGETDTLANWLVERYPEIAKVGDEANRAGPSTELRAGLVHRLDRDVSGLMVIARTQPMFEHLKAQFQDRQILKEYTALAYGKLPVEGEIDLPIGRSPEGKFVAHPRRGMEKFQAADRVAKTRYRVIEWVKEYSLVRVQILTGRTHQIRAHFSAIGHPIVGDQLYKPRKNIFTLLRRRFKVVDPGRIFLHASQLAFTDRSGARQEFTSPLPAELTDYLNGLKR